MNKEKLREYVVSKFSSFIKEEVKTFKNYNSIDGIIAQIEESYRVNKAKIGLVFILDKIADGYRIKRYSYDISYL